MKQFHTIEKLDTGILYTLELASSISVLLLAFGLIASMANVLTKGAVLTDHVWMQQVWAWTQCIAIDASVAGTIIRTFRYQAEVRERQPAPLVVTPELVETLRSLLAQTTVTEEANSPTLFLPQGEQEANNPREANGEGEDEQGANNGQRVKAYLILHPDAKVR